MADRQLWMLGIMILTALVALTVVIFRMARRRPPPLS